MEKILNFVYTEVPQLIEKQWIPLIFGLGFLDLGFHIKVISTPKTVLTLGQE